MKEIFEPHWEAEREPFFAKIDFTSLQTPAYVIHQAPLEQNLKMVNHVKARTGCKILLALKGYAAWKTFPLIAAYLDGACASSVYEARLACEQFGKEVHTFAPAYSPRDIKQLLKYTDHLIFNSFGQWKKYRPLIDRHNLRHPDKSIVCGMRINPQVYFDSVVEQYSPSAKGSRMGVIAQEFSKHEDELAGLNILHFHNLCEQGADALKKTIEGVEAQFGAYLGKMQWINFGGGHHITRKDYDRDALCELIIQFQNKYGVQVILEPGEAIALNCGVLVTQVLDIIDNHGKIAILDCSAEAHMPDVLSMPYRPAIIGASHPGVKPFSYKLGGLTCLSGDFLGSYSFDQPLQVGDRLILQNMAIYSMVKNNCFNGVPLPNIVIMDQNDQVIHTKKFGYAAYKNRLS